MNTIRDRIKFSLQITISALIGLEVSILPNVYIKPLVFLLLIYIALIHNVPDRSINVIKKFYNYIYSHDG